MTLGERPVDESNDLNFTIDELLAASDEVGRAKIESAVLRLRMQKIEEDNAKLRRELAEVSNGKNAVRAA